MKERIQGAFAVNSEKITKDFYSGFRKEHNAFAEFITGIDDQIPASKNRNKQWYTSVMLNRLIFCYFIQKKGFLDGNFDYLQEKLKWVQQERGENRFFQTFYRGFLSELFHGGLNSPRHSDEFENVYRGLPIPTHSSGYRLNPSSGLYFLPESSLSQTFHLLQRYSSANPIHSLRCIRHKRFPE